MGLIIGGVLLLLIIVAFVLEIITGRSRGGCLSSFRLFTVFLAAGAAICATLVLGKIFITGEKLSGVPAELIPLIHDLAYVFAVPVAMLILFLVCKLVMLLVYAIGAAVLKKKHAEACTSSEKAVKAKGLVCGLLIGLTVVGFFVLPCYRGVSLYGDYKTLEPSFMKIYNFTQGEKISSAELIAAVDELSDYILDVDYISDDAKVQAINYGIGLVNSTLANSGNSALGNISLGTYDTVEEHKQQVDNIVDIAKTMDEVGLLDSVIGNTDDGTAEENGEGTGGAVDAGKMLDAISDESTARNFVEAVEKLENGNEMLANIINDTVKEMSDGQLSNLIDAEALSKAENSEALVQTLTHASIFTNLNEESFNAMSNGEKQDLIDELNEIKSYGVMDSATIDDLISKIKSRME